MFAIAFLVISLLQSINVNGQSCEVGWHRFNNKCFWKSDTLATRDENLRTCRSMNAELVSIHSSQENAFIRSFVSYGSYYILGAYRVSIGRKEFKWTDGSPMDFTSWSWCEPRYINNPVANCTILSNFNVVQWFADDCRARRYQLCQKQLQPSFAGLQSELNEIKKIQQKSLQEMRNFEKMVAFNLSLIKNGQSNNQLINVNDKSNIELKTMLVRMEERLQNYIGNLNTNGNYEKLQEIDNSVKHIKNEISKLNETDNLKDIKILHKNTVDSLKNLVYELLAKKPNEEDSGFKRLHDRLTTIIEKLTEEREELRKKENSSFEILAKILNKMINKGNEEDERREIDFMNLNLLKGLK